MMWQSEKDICDMYRGALNPKKQIRILAELNDCTQADIRAVLERHGIKPQRPAPVRRRDEPYKRWTVEDMVQLLYLAANGMTDEKLARHFSRSVGAVKNMRSKIQHNSSAEAKRALEIFKSSHGAAL